MTSPHAQDRYERSDADARTVLLAGLGLALLLAGALAVSAWIDAELSAELRAGASPSPVSGLREAPTGPALQSVPARELEQHRAWEERLLGATEWVDPLNGIVRIPIERAMELSLEQGFPARGEERR